MDIITISETEKTDKLDVPPPSKFTNYETKTQETATIRLYKEEMFVDSFK